MLKHKLKVGYFGKNIISNAIDFFLLLLFLSILAQIQHSEHFYEWKSATPIKNQCKLQKAANKGYPSLRIEQIGLHEKWLQGGFCDRYFFQCSIERPELLKLLFGFGMPQMPHIHNWFRASDVEWSTKPFSSSQGQKRDWDWCREQLLNQRTRDRCWADIGTQAPDTKEEGHGFEPEYLCSVKISHCALPIEFLETKLSKKRGIKFKL